MGVVEEGGKSEASKASGKSEMSEASITITPEGYSHAINLLPSIFGA